MTRDARVPSPSNVPRLPDSVRVAVVVSQYHHELCEAMAYSAWKTLTAAGLGEDADDDEPAFVAVPAPGAFELPILAERLLETDQFDAVLCFGVLLKGETTHDFHIASAVSHALQRVAQEYGRPVLFGLLTCETLEQARARALPGGREGGHDKGREVALAAIGTLRTLAQIADEEYGDYWSAAVQREELRRRS